MTDNLPATYERQQMPATANAGSVMIEQERAVAEAQGQLTIAKRFPRDLNVSYSELMEACAMRAFAETAFYTVPNRGSGPSIRFAEEVARVYGNFEYGHRELSRSAGKSEVEVYAWDKEKNNYSKRQLTVMHILDTRQGVKKLTDQADIDNKIANVASKQIRGRILALMPKWLVQEAVERCKATLAGVSDEPISARVRKMITAFGKFGVNTDHLESYIGHKLEDTTLDELVDITGVFNAIREGAKPSEYFSVKEDQPAAAIGAAALEQLGDADPQKAAPKAAAKVKPAKAKEPAPAAEIKPEPEAGKAAEPKTAADKKPAAEPLF